MRITKTVGQYYLGVGALAQLEALIAPTCEQGGGKAVYLIDHFFQDGRLDKHLSLRDGDEVLYVDTTHEPSTDQVDAFAAQARAMGNVSALVGIGGGSVLDITKAVSNLLTNPGKAEDYQGWDLVKNPGVFKVGVPTLSGTGAEGSRTCVMMNYAKNLKLGMNSDHTVFDRLVLDPDLTTTVPADQYFFTGMDTYIHCIESLAGSYRHAFADAQSEAALTLCRKIFLSGDMKSADNREALMVASFLGGSAIGNSYVGVVHPFSAGLSMVLGMHHCVGNCVVMNAMDRFYPEATQEYRAMVKAQNVTVPSGVCKGLSDEQFDALYAATVVHEKPLINALGDDFKSILTPAVVREIFESM